ncbi:MAG: NAD(P)-binding protein [Cellvibrio sp.]
MIRDITRRDFIMGTGATLLSGCSKRAPNFPQGKLLGPDQSVGHKLRDGQFPRATREINIPVLIVGAGIAGLSCGWWLRRNGITDFHLVELESIAGGNSRSGNNSVGAFPWGAHYLPLPGIDATYVRILLSDLGVLHGDMNAPSPTYDERFLVQAPDERLFINGGWQEGLIPRAGIGAHAQKEIQQFEILMNEWSERKGSDDRYLFTIPSAMGSKDPAFLSLDKISFNDWLLQQNLRSEPLHWYVSYSCRDDFGADHRQISAWAGLHYFCCRRGLAANAQPQSVLTAPEGNGWIVERLSGLLARQLKKGSAVVRIETRAKGVSADVYNSNNQEITRVNCEHLIWAAPLFVLPRIWSGMPRLSLPEYAPWLVANLTINNVDENEFTAWDSVVYRGKGLGYVDSTHQTLQFHRPNRVLTYYNALNYLPPKVARQELLTQSHAHWSAQIFADLGKAHPQLQAQCSAIDLWRWPHAMAIPAPGFLTNISSWQQSLHPHIHIAHSDLSGFSLFEEAQYWGIEAAQKIIKA